MDEHVRISPRLLLLKLMAVLFISHYPTEFVVERFLDGGSLLVELVVEGSMLGVISGGLIWFVVLVPMRRSLEAERTVRQDREKRLVADAHRQRFEGRLGRGVEMAETEAQVLDVLERALATEFKGRQAALMLADSSGSHLQTVLDTGSGETARRCAVVEPRGCPAIRSGNTLTFDDAMAVDSCPQLRSSPGANGATCVPMQAGGRAVGVLHVPRKPGDTPIDAVTTTSLVATVGRRIGMLRVVEQTSRRAATDELTGLSNRRAAEDAALNVLQTGRAAVVLADLDRFKLLNDTHGHATGDRALKLFADALRAVVRPEDVVARYGGEEFLLVLPNADVTQAEGVTTRLRSHLAATLLEAKVPAFTCSFGIVDTSHSKDLAELVRLADVALYRAKHDGRDRAVTIRDLPVWREDDTRLWRDDDDRGWREDKPDAAGTEAAEPGSTTDDPTAVSSSAGADAAD